MNILCNNKKELELVMKILDIELSESILYPKNSHFPIIIFYSIPIERYLWLEAKIFYNINNKYKSNVYIENANNIIRKEKLKKLYNV